MKAFLGPSIRVLWFSCCALAALAQSPETLARSLRNSPSVATRTALTNYAKAHPRDTNGALALLALAVHDVEAKVPQRAIATLKQVRPRLPQLRDYVDYFLAQAQFNANQFEDAAETASKIGDSAMLPVAASITTRSMIQIGRPKDAVTYLHSKARQIGDPQETFLLALALEAAGDNTAAISAYRAVYVAHPKSGEAPLARTALDKLGVALNPQERFQRGSNLLATGDATGAKIEFQAALADLTGEEREIAKVRLGDALLRTRETTAALAQLRSFTAKDPELDAERVAHAVTAARRLKQLDLAESLAASMIPKDKSSRWRVEALVAMGNQALIDGDAGKQEKFYRACADSTSDSSYVPYCRWKLAFSAYRNRKANAFEDFLALVERHPSSTQASAALYFMGRLAESAKNPVTAKSFYLRINENFANHYYAVLARERLDDPAIRSETASPAFPNLAWPVQEPDFAATPETKLRASRSRLLATAGLDDYAEREIRYHRNAMPANQAALELASLASRRGDHAKGIRHIKGNYPGYLSLPLDRAPAEFWKLAYPIPYREDLERNAKARGLDPFLVAGLIRQESEFNPTAISRAKAQGLMQVMPATGREISRKLGVKPFTTEKLLDPKISLQFGTYHFKSWLDALNGNVEVTLAAYNAGKSRADRWVAASKWRETAEFVETIPFTETREYVQAVIRNADLYRRLYGGATASLPSLNAAESSTGDR
jgi:soluble lytic murein transglycosylase